MSFKQKIVSLKEMQHQLPALRRLGYKIAFTNGCFDLMHLGHVSYLEKAKSGKVGEKRILIVGLNSDKSVSTIKDSGRPISNERSRAAVVAALSSVDYVVLFNETSPLRTIKTLLPDVLIKGADYKNKEVVGSSIVKDNGGAVELIPFSKGFSTSHIITKIVKHYGK